MPPSFLTCRTERTPQSGVYRVIVTEHPFRVDLSARIARIMWIENARVHPERAAADGRWLVYGDDRATPLSVGWATLRDAEQAVIDIASGYDPRPAAKGRA